MAAGLDIKVEGFDRVIKKLGKMPAELLTQTDRVISNAAKGMEKRAVMDVPVDQSALKQTITTEKVGVSDYRVVASAYWAPFIEFGTKRRAKIPADLTAYAAQFKGKKGGNGQGFYDSILEWVKRKGIAGTYNVKTRRREGSKVDQQVETEQVAFAIYLSIMRNGIHADPFFFKHLPQAQKEIETGIKEAVERALK